MCKNHDYCHVKIPEAHNKKLNYNQDQKSIKIPFIVYADTESLPEKIHTCDNDPEKLFTSKIKKYIACGYSLFAHCSYDNKKE